jgi:anti-anti-sigma factor
MVANLSEASVRRQGGVSVIDLRGDIDRSAEEVMSRAYEEAIADGALDIILNFENVGYINSTGIAVIVGLLARARTEKRTVTACGLSPHYEEIFQITRLADFMRMFPDEASAVATRSSTAKED